MNMDLKKHLPKRFELWLLRALADDSGVGKTHEFKLTLRRVLGGGIEATIDTSESRSRTFTGTDEPDPGFEEPQP